MPISPDNPFPLMRNATDIHDTVCSFLPRADILALYQTSRWNQHRTQNSLKAQQAIEIITKHAGESFGQFLPLPDINPVNLDERLSEAVLRAVVLGNEELVLALLKLHPEALLDNTQTVTDYSDKVISGLTPFQAALCAGDEILIEKLAAMLINDGPDGQAIMREQFEAIYPNGDIDVFAKAQEDSANKCKLLDDIFAAIEEASDDEALAALAVITKPDEADDQLNEKDKGTLAYALKKFRLGFDQVSQAETVHNAYHLVKAHELYDWYSGVCDNYGSPKNTLAWRQVIGYVQRHVPACLAQDCAHTIYEIANGNTQRKDVRRSVNFRKSGGSFFSSSLGYEYVGWGGGAWGHWEWPYSACAVGFDKNYVEQKHQCCRNLYNLCKSPTKQTFVVA